MGNMALEEPRLSNTEYAPGLSSDLTWKRSQTFTFLIFPVVTKLRLHMASPTPHAMLGQSPIIELRVSLGILSEGTGQVANCEDG